jgi:hypothetical protein
MIGKQIAKAKPRNNKNKQKQIKKQNAIITMTMVTNNGYHDS